MARKADSEYSDESDNGAMIAWHAQQRINQLKKERNERLNEVVAEASAALDDLDARIQTYLKKQRLEVEKKLAECVATIAEKVERRRTIELEMSSVVEEMVTCMKELEDMMLTGYAGRLKDVERVMQAALGDER